MRAVTNDPSVLLTRDFTPCSGSAIDPLVEEVTWQAWELEAFDPERIHEGSLSLINSRFDMLVEAAWLPGRSAVLSELTWTPEGLGSGDLSVCLGVGLFGPRGATRAESVGLVPRIKLATSGAGMFTARNLDPVRLVPGLDDTSEQWSPTEPQERAAHLSQSMWSVGDEHDLVEIVSRFNPTYEPWAGVVDQLVELRQPVKVRATVLATELSPADRLEIEQDLQRLRAIKDRSADRPEVLFDVDRAEATLLDIRASFSSPVLVCEIAVTSNDVLSDTLLRSIAASFTSENDVLRQQGRVVVAVNRLVLGGFDIDRDPPGWRSAQSLGIPLRGGLVPRRLRDLVTLTESPIGWPVMPGRPLPSIDTHLPVERDVPAPLRVDPTVAESDEHTVVGLSRSGIPVVLPVDLRTRHMIATGSWGAGKSTFLFRLALDDLRRGRPFVFVDPHGTTADLLIEHARWLGRNPVVIDPAEPFSDSLHILPLRGRSTQQRISSDAAIQRLADAISASQLNPEWAGPRWHATVVAVLELLSVHGGELVDAVTWLNNEHELKARLQDSRLSGLASSTLANLARSSGDAGDVRGWASSKFHPLVSGMVRHILAPVGQGVDLGAALSDGRAVMVNLSSLARSEVSMVGHLVGSAVLDWAFNRAKDRRSLVTLYQDELAFAPVRGVARAFAEGRKFGVSFVAATQSLGQLPDDLADLAVSAGTQVTFRATPDTAARMAPILGVPARELIRQPDLHATLMVQGVPTTSVVLPPYEPCPSADPEVITSDECKAPRTPRNKPSNECDGMDWSPSLFDEIVLQEE